MVPRSVLTHSHVSWLVSCAAGVPLTEGSVYCHLVAECEDLRSAMCQTAEERDALREERDALREERDALREELVAAQTGLHQASLVSQLEVEVCGLRKELEGAEGRWREERAQLEKEKKAALEE